MKSAVIIGGGPAGCQCALWLKMLGYEAIIIEQANQLGGLQATSPYQNNWLVGVMNVTGQELAHRMQSHLEQMQVPFLLNSTAQQINPLAHGFSVSVNKKTIETRHIVIAAGVKAKSGSLQATDDILIGPGQCVFDYPFTGKRVAILGSGDNAAENYAFIKEKNPAHCHIYARTIRARKDLWMSVDENDIYDSPYEVDQKTLIVTQQNRMRESDVIVVLYGWEANIPAIFAPFKGQLLNAQGFIATNESCGTRLPGVYAIGEITNRANPCVSTAMADGVVAAKAIQQAEER